MKLRVLGCSGAMAAGYKTTAFYLEPGILIDAGTGVGDLELEALAQIDHVLLTHSHLDHVLGLPLLADAVLRLRRQAGRPPIQVHALAATLEALRAHLFNGVIWPDFTRLPSAAQPVLTLQSIEVGQVLSLQDAQGHTHHIEVLSARHTVPACGFAVALQPGRHWVYTGDTGPNPALWERLAHLQVTDLVIETAFSDDEAALAEASLHLCPRLLAEELTHLAPGTPVHITHMKPGEVAAVMQALQARGLSHRVSALRAGQVFGAG